MSEPPEESVVASRVADAAIVGGLLVLGIGVVYLPRFVDVTPERLAKATRVAIFILTVVVAGIWILLRKARRDLRRVEGLLTDVLFGAGTKRDREAVDILVRALRAPDSRAKVTALRTLRKISGVDLGEDPGPWEAWWTASRATFTRPGPQPGKK